MNRIVRKIVEIDGGDITTYGGDYDFYDTQRGIAAQQAEAQYARQQAMLAKEARFIERFKTHAAKAAQVQSRVKKLDKIEKLEEPRRRSTVEFDFRAPPRSGEAVAKLEGVIMGYGARRIYDGLDLIIRRRERVCVMGVNGAGKSTLLRLIAGVNTPQSGKVTIGASVKVGYFAQHAMELLKPELTISEELTFAFPHASIGTLRTLAGCFGFSGDDIEKPCRILSGGEKARLVLAKMLFDPPNFLVLDEPTNHLDMATKEMLVKALSTFEGTMLFVSHDRHFLGAISNRVLEIVPHGGARAASLPPPAKAGGPTPERKPGPVEVVAYGGGYLEYVAASGHEAPGLRV
jgi:ATPase subunit of ABC transporter with duplicated ATPase domains